MRRNFPAILLSLALLIGSFGSLALGPRALPADNGVETLTLSATGTAGAATGTVTGTRHLWGYIKAINVDYTAGISSTTDITITTAAPAATIMVKTNSMTDTWYYPSVQLTDSSGAAVSGAYGRFPVDDYVIVQGGDTTSGTVAMVHIYYGQ